MTPKSRSGPTQTKSERRAQGRRRFELWLNKGSAEKFEQLRESRETTYAALVESWIDAEANGKPRQKKK